MTIKRLFISAFLFLLYSSCFGQKVIPLTKKDGVYTIPCSINGVKRSLVFDTGASTVTISMQLAEILFNSGRLLESDIIGQGKSQIASGHIIDNMAIVLRDIEISGLHLKNVDAVIIEGQNVPLLLGLSAIQKLGRVTLSGNKLIVDSPLLDNVQLVELRTRIDDLIDNANYGDAINLLKRIEAQEALEETDLYNLARCYCYSEEYNKALMYSQQWIGLYNDLKSPHEPEICDCIGLAYMGLESHYDADEWFSKAITLVGMNRIEETNHEDASTLSYYYSQKAVNYLKAKAYDRSVEAFDIATQYRMRFLGASIEDLCAGRVEDNRVGMFLQSMSQLYGLFLNNIDSAQRFAILAALCGNQEAIDFCNHFNLDYNPRK